VKTGGTETVGQNRIVGKGKSRSNGVIERRRGKLPWRQGEKKEQERIGGERSKAKKRFFWGGRRGSSRSGANSCEKGGNRNWKEKVKGKKKKVKEGVKVQARTDGNIVFVDERKACSNELPTRVCSELSETERNLTSGHIGKHRNGFQESHKTQSTVGGRG